MKQFEIKCEREIGGNRFYIRPIPAFKCANLSGELGSMIIPIIGAIAPYASEALKGDGANIFDVDAEVAAPALAKGLASLNGDKLELLLKKLLTTYNNVSVEVALEDGGFERVQNLTYDLGNEIFIGAMEDMAVLVYEVIKVNFPSIFKKLDNLFGNVADIFQKKAGDLETTGN